MVSNWRLELEGSSDLSHLATVLQENSTASDIDCCINDSLAEKPTLEVVSFFEKVGRTLHGLRKLEFYPGTGSYNAFPIEALGAALQQTNTLESLYVYHLELQGDNIQFQAFARQLEQQLKLKELCFIDCQMHSDQEVNDLAFDPIVRSLGRLCSVEVVAIWANDLGGLTTESLVQVCRSSSIKRLMILGFDICDDEVSRIFKALERNTSLKRLNLSCSIGAEGCEAISQMLQKNSKMEKLKIELDSLDNEKDLFDIAQGLKRNSSLNYFKLSGGPESRNGELEESFHSALECNMSLETLSLLDGFLHSPRMDLYLKLNRNGRRLVLQGETKDKEPWVEALVKSNSDLDCIFYFLSINPALCLS